MTILELSSWQDLHGTIPNEIGQLTNMVLLSLAGNRLSGTLPASMGNLYLLTNIHISYAPDLISTLPPEWANMQALSVLRFAHFFTTTKCTNVCKVSSVPVFTEPYPMNFATFHRYLSCYCLKIST